MNLPEPFIPVNPECEVLTARTFNAPPDLLFKAFSRPEHLKNWWGPHGFTNTFNHFDFKEGGSWSFIMHGPDGSNYPNEVVFIKIDEPSRVVMDHICLPYFKAEFTLTRVTDTETSLSFRMIFPTKEDCDKLRGFVTEKNEENFDRLEVELSRIMV